MSDGTGLIIGEHKEPRHPIMNVRIVWSERDRLGVSIGSSMIMAKRQSSAERKLSIRQIGSQRHSDLSRLQRFLRCLLPIREMPTSDLGQHVGKSSVRQ